MEVKETVEAVEELAREAEAGEIAEAVVEAVIENANERIAEAEETAERIAEAAIQGERARHIEELRKEIYECREHQENHQREIADLFSQMEILRGQIAALSTMQVASQSSIPQTLTEAPAMETAMEEIQVITPESLLESEEAVQPVAPAPLVPKRRRWI